MTLARQLFIGVCVAFVVLLAGIESIYVATARGHLEEQLDAHANETATSLALSIGARAGTLDSSVVSTLVSAVFDRGHFASIEVLSPSGERLFGRTLERRAAEVPAWFVAMVPLEGRRGEALVTSGWRQLGRVVVQVHPGYAYQQLYRTTLATLAWLAALFAAVLVALRHYLASILRPLHQIEQAAASISNRQFVSIDIEPRARELARVTQAMNSLSSKIRAAIERESERAEQLRKQAFEDSLTGQLNRRGFEQAVAATLDDGGDVHAGALAVYALTGIQEVNRLFGLARGDEIVSHLARTLGAAGPHGAPIIGRWQGPALAVFAPDAPSQAALSWARGICEELPARLREQGLPEGVSLSCGIAHFGSDGVKWDALAAAAERALAESMKSGGAVLVEAESGVVAGSAAGHEEIEAAIEQGRLSLLGQDVRNVADDSLVHLEILSALIRRDGSPIPAGVFVPVASQHGLLPRLDRWVVQRTLEALQRNPTLPATVSLNISMQGIADPTLRRELGALLARCGPIAPRLVFEVTGFAASRSPELTLAFAREVSEHGARVALDNFDLDRNAMTIVHALLPAYVKLAPACTHEIAAREDLRFIVEAMVRMTRPLDIPLIAQGVEDKAVLPILAELGLAAFQGYAGGRPQPIQIA